MSNFDNDPGPTASWIRGTNQIRDLMKKFRAEIDAALEEEAAHAKDLPAV